MRAVCATVSHVISAVTRGRGTRGGRNIPPERDQRRSSGSAARHLDCQERAAGTEPAEESEKRTGLGENHTVLPIAEVGAIVCGRRLPVGSPDARLGGFCQESGDEASAPADRATESRVACPPSPASTAPCPSRPFPPRPPTWHRHSAPSTVPAPLPAVAPARATGLSRRPSQRRRRQRSRSPHLQRRRGSSSAALALVARRPPRTTAAPGKRPAQRRGGSPTGREAAASRGAPPAAATRARRRTSPRPRFPCSRKTRDGADGAQGWARGGPAPRAASPRRGT